MSSLPTIIIPYYKLAYFDAALASLAAQTLGEFKVFVGDDASPEDPGPVLEKYRDRLDLEYHRFENNLGRVSLTRHWDRCVEKTRSEWIWLFSDDDVAEPGCMAAFERTLQKTAEKFDVYRFNTRTIDGRGELSQRHTPHPEVETVEEFALAKIMDERFSFAVEYIFRRAAYDRAAGFKHFPMAWCSDDASWISFAGRSGFRLIEGANIHWRKSGLNISSPDPRHIRQKLQAFQGYLKWLEKELPDADFQSRLKQGISRKFPDQIQHWGGNPGRWEGLRFWCFFAHFTGRLNLSLLKTLMESPAAANVRGLTSA